MKNIIQFRNGFVNLPNENGENRLLVMSVVSELMQFGFLLDENAITNLSKSSESEIIKFHNEVIDFLKEITGSKKSYKPFWKNFPTDVMGKSESELWFHQIIHYLSNGNYEPSELVTDRPTAFEKSSYTVITEGDESQFLNIFTRLVSVNQSLTGEDLSTVSWFINSGTELIFPPTIPFKENLTTVLSEVSYQNRKINFELPRLTVTDVLRVCIGMSGGDVSLPKVPRKLVKLNRWSNHLSNNPARDSFKFKKFKRSERKFILTLLESTNCDVTEAVLKDQRWIRLGEIIHPGEYRNQFPKSFKMFNTLRNEKVISWYGKVNKEFNSSFESGLNTLSNRPGEFLRRIDSLVRNNENKIDLILNTLNDVCEKVSNKVLYETYTHFQKRMSVVHNRKIMIKGSRTTTMLPELPALDKNIVSKIQNTLIKGLKSKFSTLDKLENVFIDEKLKFLPIPSNMRSLNPSLKPVVRGTRTPIGNVNTKVLRTFVHWFDERGNQDIDLTCTLIGLGKKSIIGWNGEHNSVYGSYSGDVRHRKGPCAEYIDINISKSLKSGFKYGIIDIRNYNGGSLEDITDCVGGFMEREYPQYNEIFVPSTLNNTVRLNSPSSNTVVGIIDLETLEYVHLDIDTLSLPVSSCDDVVGLVEEFTKPPKFSVYDLLKLHVESRNGKIVSDDSESNLKLNFEDFSNDYINTLSWMGV